MTRLRQVLTERILVLDGAMGTMLQAANLSASDFGGPALEGCNEHLNLMRPDVIRSIHGYGHASSNNSRCAGQSRLLEETRRVEASGRTYDDEGMNMPSGQRRTDGVGCRC